MFDTGQERNSNLILVQIITRELNTNTRNTLPKRKMENVILNHWKTGPSTYVSDCCAF